MIQFQFLKKILDSKDMSLITLNNITADYFSDYRSEFDFIKNHFDTYGNVPDKETFYDKFPDFPSTTDVVQESNQYLLEELYRDRNKHKLASVFNQIRDCINKDDTDRAVAIFENSIEDISKAKQIQCVDILKDTSRYDDYLAKCQDFNKFYVKTGFNELDQLIGGWDRQEELATIVARTGIGKSWALLKCAVEAAKQGLNVGLYSGEMSENKVGFRADTLISHISNYGIVQGKTDVQVAYKKHLEALQEIKGSIKVLTPAMINGIAGVSALRAFVEKEKLDILFVDQHSLLEDDRRGKSSVEKASNISKDLKSLQVLKKIPIISVSQQNRTSVENGVDSTQIAQSDRIGQDSTIILFLEQKDGILTMTIVKSRDSGGGKKLRYAVDYDHGTYEFLPAEDSANDSGCESLKDEYEYSDEEVF